MKFVKVVGGEEEGFRMRARREKGVQAMLVKENHLRTAEEAENGIPCKVTHTYPVWEDDAFVASGVRRYSRDVIVAAASARQVPGHSNDSSTAMYSSLEL